MIALITPTGGRPKQIELCAKWMRNQTYNKPVLWVIVDDCDPITTDFLTSDYMGANWLVARIYPDQKWQKGMNTQSRNLMLGIELAEKWKPEHIYIIEDDDYYSPKYLRLMEARFRNVNANEEYDLIGEMNSVYYNPMRQTFKRMINRQHSSLFQTGFSKNLIPQFKRILEQNMKFIDISLWKGLKVENKRLYRESNTAIGIKGLPGRGGIGIGHVDRALKLPDRQLTFFKSILGKDYKEYESLII